MRYNRQYTTLPPCKLKGKQSVNKLNAKYIELHINENSLYKNSLYKKLSNTAISEKLNSYSAHKISKNSTKRLRKRVTK